MELALKIVMPLIGFIMMLIMTILGWLWHRVNNCASKDDIKRVEDNMTHHKDKVQYKENCGSITQGFTNEISRLGELMKNNFENQEKLEQEKMKFYKEQIGKLAENDKHVIEKIDSLARRRKK